MREDRREFLRSLAAAAVASSTGSRALFAGEGRDAIAYTSFAVRLQRGRDLIRGAGAPSLPAETFIDLCRSFGADGCQLDLSQVASTEPAALDALKKRLGDAGLFLELSVGGKSLEDEQRFNDAVSIARRLGALRLRVALLSGRR